MSVMQAHRHLAEDDVANVFINNDNDSKICLV